MCGPKSLELITSVISKSRMLLHFFCKIKLLADKSNTCMRMTFCLLLVFFICFVCLFVCCFCLFASDTPFDCKVRCSRDRIVIWFTTIYMRSVHITTNSRSWRDILDATLCVEACQWLSAGRWFSPGTPVYSTNETDRNHRADIVESGVKHHNPNPKFDNWYL